MNAIALTAYLPDLDFRCDIVSAAGAIQTAQAGIHAIALKVLRQSEEAMEMALLEADVHQLGLFEERSEETFASDWMSYKAAGLDTDDLY